MPSENEQRPPSVAIVRESLERMDAGEASPEVFAVIVAAAREYSLMTLEFGFESPDIAGVAYATRNDMLIETMSAARPSAKVLFRYAPDWNEDSDDY